MTLESRRVVSMRVDAMFCRDENLSMQICCGKRRWISLTAEAKSLARDCHREYVTGTQQHYQNDRRCI